MNKLNHKQAALNISHSQIIFKFRRTFFFDYVHVEIYTSFRLKYSRHLFQTSFYTRLTYLKHISMF